MSDKRVDPDDGAAYTREELSAFYKGKYTKAEIAAYWDTCKPVKAKGKGKGKGDEPKSKAKVKAKAKPVKKEPKPLSRQPADPDEVVKRVTACKVIPVIALDSADHAVPLSTAMLEGGIDIAEITFRTACAPEACKKVYDELSSKGVMVLAGTILEPDQVDIAIEAGCDGIISPGWSAAVWKRCQQRKCLYLPAVVTPSEVMLLSSRFKLKCLKFFPASNYGGAGTLKSFGAVFQDIKFMPTGGVTLANIHEFVGLPNVIAAGGTWFVKPDDVQKAFDSGDWKPLAAAAKIAKEAADKGAHK